jgi:hypothetical protein
VFNPARRDHRSSNEEVRRAACAVDDGVPVKPATNRPCEYRVRQRRKARCTRRRDHRIGVCGLVEQAAHLGVLVPTGVGVIARNMLVRHNHVENHAGTVRAMRGAVRQPQALAQHQVQRQPEDQRTAPATAQGWEHQFTLKAVKHNMQPRAYGLAQQSRHRV